MEYTEKLILLHGFSFRKEVIHNWHLPVKASSTSEIPLAGANSTYFYKNQFRQTFQTNIFLEKIVNCNLKRSLIR